MRGFVVLCFCESVSLLCWSPPYCCCVRVARGGYEGCPHPLGMGMLLLALCCACARARVRVCACCIAVWPACRLRALGALGRARLCSGMLGRAVCCYMRRAIVVLSLGVCPLRVVPRVRACACARVRALRVRSAATCARPEGAQRGARWLRCYSCVFSFVCPFCGANRLLYGAVATWLVVWVPDRDLEDTGPSGHGWLPCVVACTLLRAWHSLFCSRARFACRYFCFITLVAVIPAVLSRAGVRGMCPSYCLFPVASWRGVFLSFPRPSMGARVVCASAVFWSRGMETTGVVCCAGDATLWVCAGAQPMFWLCLSVPRGTVFGFVGAAVAACLQGGWVHLASWRVLSWV